MFNFLNLIGVSRAAVYVKEALFLEIYTEVLNCKGQDVYTT